MTWLSCKASFSWDPSPILLMQVFKVLEKRPLISPVTALWGTSTTKVPFYQMVMLTGGWPDWRRLYIWNGPTNLGIRLPAGSCRKKACFWITKQKPGWSTCAVLWTVMACAIMSTKPSILKQNNQFWGCQGREQREQWKFIFHSPPHCMTMWTLRLKVAFWCSGCCAGHLFSGWQPKPVCFTVWRISLWCFST